jgi:glycosyltransferase involved in cell wall biosynthesis
MEQWAYRQSAMVNVLTPAFREDILSRGLAPAAKICCIPNGADVSTFAPGPRDNDVRREFGWGDRIVALYAGAHGKANAIGQLVDTAERLRERADILIATVGDGPERARWEREAESRGLKNIRFFGPQPKDRMPEIVRASDIGLAVLQDNPTFKTVYPNKVFDYMACERPTVLAIDGIARRLVCDEARAGLYAAPENAAAIADAISTLADDPLQRSRLGMSGRAWVLEHATRESRASAYLDVLGQLVRPDGSAAVAALRART